MRYHTSTWFVLFAVIFALLTFVGLARAHDMDHPEDTAWYEALKMPDAPSVSCCGEADAYFADSFEAQGDQYVAIITDDRPDEPRHRKHVDVGTRIVVPNHKIQWKQGNPTGHGVIFLSPAEYVYCYVPPGGV